MKNRSRITKVSIKGFCSMKDVQVELKDLNILIGPNGSGKSNFIRFFQMLNYALTRSLHKFVSTRGFSNSMLFMGAKVTPTLSGSLEMQRAQGKNGYQFQMADAALDSLIYTHEKMLFWRDGGGHTKPQEYDLEVGGKESAIKKASQGAPSDPLTELAKVTYNLLSKVRVYQFHDTSSTTYIRKTTDIDKDRYLYSDAGNLAAVLYSLKENEAPYYQRIVKILQRTVPDFKDFILEPEVSDPNKIMLRWRGADPEYEFGPHQISDGTLRFMALTTLLKQPEDRLPDIVIIDEPELGLHPEAEALLCGMLRSVSRRCQVIVATQSATLLDAFDPEDIIVAEIENGATSLKRQSPDDLKKWLERYTLGEVWRKNLMGGLP